MISKPERYLGHAAPGAEVDYYHTYYIKEFVAWIESHPLVQISGTAVEGHGFYQIEPGEIKELLKEGGGK